MSSPPPTTLNQFQAEVLHRLADLEHHLKKPHYKPTPNPILKQWLVDNLLYIIIIVQLLDIIFLSILDTSTRNFKDGKHQHVSEADKSLYTAGFVISLIIQSLLLVTIAVFSVKLIKQVQHRTVSIRFLLHSYLSTTLLFAGIYLTLERINHDYFYILANADRHNSFEMFFRFVYFSLSIMTTAAISDIAPLNLLLQIIVSFQMLVSYVYMTLIFAKGLSHFTDNEQIEKDFIEFKKKRDLRKNGVYSKWNFISRFTSEHSINSQSSSSNLLETSDIQSSNSPSENYHRVA